MDTERSSLPDTITVAASGYTLGDHAGACTASLSIASEATTIAELQPRKGYQPDDQVGVTLSTGALPAYINAKVLEGDKVAVTVRGEGEQRASVMELPITQFRQFLDMCSSMFHWTRLFQPLGEPKNAHMGPDFTWATPSEAL